MVGARGEVYPKDQPKVGSTILVVEDEVLVRMVIADNLRRAGFTVIEASNAHEALEVLRNSSDVRLVFSDIRMPGSMNGVKFAGLVRSEYPSIKIVLTSGNLAAVDWAMHDGFFRKPYSAVEVVQHIGAILD